MTCGFMERWLKDESVMNTAAPLLSQTWTQIFPYDPMRFSVIVGNYSGGSVAIWFGDNKPTGQAITIPPQSYAMIITYDQIGDLITYPIWGWIQTATISIQMTTVSFNPNRYKYYLEKIREHFSDFNAP